MFGKKKIEQVSGSNMNNVLQKGLIPGSKCLVASANGVGSAIYPMDENVVQTPEWITEKLKLYAPTVCPICGSTVIINVDKTAYNCSKFICRKWIYLCKYKNIFGLEKTGEVELLKLFNKLKEGRLFEEWMLQKFREAPPQKE